MCLYCACSVVLNRDPVKEERYVESLLKEIESASKLLAPGTFVNQVHFGGGTPTKLSIEQLTRIVEALNRCFTIMPDAEVSMEIDPRTVVQDDGEKLRCLRDLGFNRVSFGVQDTNEQVQEAVKRRQSYDMTKKTFLKARSLGFSGINIDLIYGLPCQTIDSFKTTVEQIIYLNPDRIALFSYAKVPHIKPHQKAIPDSLLPSTEDKFAIYKTAREGFIKSGYTAIGMDHFASKTDPLTERFKSKTLLRNFQGYTLYSGEDMLGLGLTSISFMSDGYFQNVKELTEYHRSISNDVLPLERGAVLTEEDHKRRYVINRLMCDFAVQKGAFKARFGIDFDAHFTKSLALLQEHIADGLVENRPDAVVVTNIGEMFIRNIASCFDEYLSKNHIRPFSKAI